MPIPILCWVAHGTHVQRVSRFIAHRMHKHENFVRATVTQAMRVYRTYIQDIIMLRYAKHIYIHLYTLSYVTFMHCLSVSRWVAAVVVGLFSLV